MKDVKPVILCVDDEEVTLKLLEAILVGSGYQVVFALSGMEALQIIKSRPIDLVLLDIGMPGMDGIEVGRQIKDDENLRDIPIIMVTGLTSQEDHLRGIEVGVEDYFTKPFNRIELLARIKILLKVKKLSDQRRQAEEALKKSHDELEHQVKLRTAELAKANDMLTEDIAERKRMEAKYYDLYNHAPDMYFSLDMPTATIRECNERFLQVTGYSREELIGRTVFELYDESSLNDAKNALQLFLKTGEIRDAERRVKCKDGHIMEVSLNVSAIRDEEGNIKYSRSIWRDITEQKRNEEMIRTLSVTDQLTGLYNRRGFITLVEQHLRITERTKSGMLLLYCDMDGLKQINDTSGHKLGDEAIAETAAVLKEVFREMDIIARMGGDEFAVLVTEASLEHSELIKNRLQNQMDIHNARAGRDYNLSLSVGMVYHDPAVPISLDALISRADALMYEQKHLKKSRSTSNSKSR